MKTTIYLIRHSKPMKNRINITNSDNLQVWNEKNPLSVDGEIKAKELSISKEMEDIDIVISSTYVRAMSTAKYIAEQNNKDLYIIENFGERKHGVNSWDELPEGFEERQKAEIDFKVGTGESRREVSERMYNALFEVLEKNKGKRIAIISHSTAIAFLLIKLGRYENETIYFKDKPIIDKNFKWTAPEVFKLEFDNSELINIESIKEY